MIYPFDHNTKYLQNLPRLLYLTTWEIHPHTNIISKGVKTCRNRLLDDLNAPEVVEIVYSPRRKIDNPTSLCAGLNLPD